MKSWIYSLLVSAFPLTAIAHDEIEKPLWHNLLVASFPILIFIFVFWLFMRSMNKNGKNINERILESNLEIAKELKRIAGHVEKQS